VSIFRLRFLTGRHFELPDVVDTVAVVVVASLSMATTSRSRSMMGADDNLLSSMVKQLVHELDSERCVVVSTVNTPTSSASLSVGCVVNVVHVQAVYSSQSSSLSSSFTHSLPNVTR